MKLLVVGVLCVGAVACKGDDKEASGTSSSQATAASSQAPSHALTDFDYSGMSEAQKNRFDRLAGSLSSPCGKSHSLAKSYNEDQTCMSRTHAAIFLQELVKDGLEDPKIENYFDRRYGDKKSVIKPDTSGAPREGSEDANVTLIEYYDYACGICKKFAPDLEKVMDKYGSKVQLHYLQLPLRMHKDSPMAARAALAAHRQGKFKEMHRLLFENNKAHKKSDLDRYAAQLGLDMALFQKDYNAMEAVVTAQSNFARSKGITGTPTILVNGLRMYAPKEAKYVSLFIDEALETTK